MIVYKFGGALARTKRGLESLARLTRERHLREQTRARRSSRKGTEHGLVVVVSAIGHTTRYLSRAAELAEEGKLIDAEASIDRSLAQHEQLVQSLRLESEDTLLETFETIANSTRALLEGIAITRELSPRTRDAVIAHGESFAIALVHALLAERDVPVHAVDAREVIVTNEAFGHASPDLNALAGRVERMILPRIRRGAVVLIQGFIGATPDGVTTTMGNESSDLTATILAAALHAEEVIIWKMLPGIYSADPELVPHAKLIRALSFEEAEEIGRRGARVLYPTFARPLLKTSPKTVLRIATPVGAATRHTLLSRDVPNAVRKQRPLAVALEERLISLAIAPRVEQSSARDRMKRDRMELALTEAMISWRTASETIAIIERDSKRIVQRAIDRELFSVKEGTAIAAISVVVRKLRTEPFAETFVAAIARSLRPFHIHAILPVEQSLIIFVNESNGRAALKKLHHDLFEA